MSKIQINKEIVLLRKNVEQAKIHIIKKHTRDAMKLRKKKGTDAQKEKNTRKADRIAAEILAIKKVKNDEVTKHILTHTLNLQEILNDRNSESLTRMMARIANHKIFSKKIAEFKEKYPNYMEFLGPGRKKKAIMEWKEKKKLKKMGVDTNEAGSDKLSEHQNSEECSGEEESSEGEDESDDAESNNELVSKSEQFENKNEERKEEESLNKKLPASDDKNKVKKVKKVPENEESLDKKVSVNDVENKVKKVPEEEESSNEKVSVNDVKNKVKKTKTFPEESEKTETLETSKPEKSQKRKKAISEIKEDAPSSKKLKKKKKTDIPKVISKQAVVKKFTEILKEDESNVDKEEIDYEPVEPSIQVEKEEDPFFVTGDGQSNYLSVAPIRNKSDDKRNDYEEDKDDYRGNRFNNKKFSRQDNDKYFSNVSKFKNGNFKQADARWDAPKRNGKAYDKEKPGRNANFSKFNDEQRDKSKPFRKQSKGGIESTSNEILHPSWEAKKKQQEALKKGFQGKKIVFGDDDV